MYTLPMFSQLTAYIATESDYFLIGTWGHLQPVGVLWDFYVIFKVYYIFYFMHFRYPIFLHLSWIS